MIVVESHKKKLENIKKAYPGAIIHDVTSHSTDEYIRFSPFYPNHGIPVPYSPGVVSESVEGIWQGLKVFESVGCDLSLFKNDTMKNLKRTERKFGTTIGHRKGVSGDELLDYIGARQCIYIPTYKWVLDNRLQTLVEKLRQESENNIVVLLDYETNSNVYNSHSPLSHASLIKAYIENSYPTKPEYYDDKEEKEDPHQSLEAGITVVHHKFGEGVVISVKGDYVQVNFQSVGQKTLDIHLAKLDIKGKNMPSLDVSTKKDKNSDAVHRMVSELREEIVNAIFKVAKERQENKISPLGMCYDYALETLYVHFPSNNCRYINEDKYLDNMSIWVAYGYYEGDGIGENRWSIHIKDLRKFDDIDALLHILESITPMTMYLQKAFSLNTLKGKAKALHDLLVGEISRIAKQSHENKIDLEFCVGSEFYKDLKVNSSDGGGMNNNESLIEVEYDEVTEPMHEPLEEISNISRLFEIYNILRQNFN